MNVISKIDIKSIPFKIKNRIGSGADGEVYSISKDKVIKFSIRYDCFCSWSKEDFDRIKSRTKSNFDFIINNKQNDFVDVFDFNFLSEGERVFNNTLQKYFTYYYVMNKLVPINESDFIKFNLIYTALDCKITYNKLFKFKNNFDSSYNKYINFLTKILNSKICHEDIHPKNIMMDENNNFKMIDVDRIFIKRY